MILQTSIDQLQKAAETMITYAGDQRVFLFYGAMGSGKTTLIKYICHVLGVRDTVTSPTFAIVHEYLGRANDKIYHFDFYRIRHQLEVLDMGYEDYFYSGNYCFIEWPEKIPDLIPKQHIYIDIAIENINTRNLWVKTPI